MSERGRGRGRGRGHGRESRNNQNDSGQKNGNKNNNNNITVNNNISSIPTKFDNNLNSENWVNFIINLRKNSLKFGLISQTIKYEKKKVFRLPVLPKMTAEELRAYKDNPQYEVYKNKVRNIIDQAGKYDTASITACDMLISDQYMSDDIRAQVLDHELYPKVLRNLEPTADECERYAISTTAILNVNDENSSIMSEDELNEFMNNDEDTVVNRELGEVVESGIEAQNVVLLLKIIRSVVLRLGPDTIHIQTQQWDRCFQKELPFITWLDQYKERVHIIQTMTNNTILTDTAIRDHFLIRVDQIKHGVPLEAIHALETLPSWKQCIRIIKNHEKRTVIRNMEYRAIMGNLQNNNNYATAFSTTTKTPTRPCKYCNEMHMDYQCNNRSKNKDSNNNNSNNKSELKCYLCDGNHKMAECPYKESAREAAKNSSNKSNNYKEKNVEKLTKMFSAMGKYYTPKEIISMTKEAVEKGGVIDDTKSSFMVNTSSLRGEHKIYLDSCSQEIIFNDKKMLKNLKPCLNDIILSGIVDSSDNKIVKSKGCGKIFGITAYYVPEATNNLISYGKLLKAGFNPKLENNGELMIISDNNNNIIIKAKCVNNLMEIYYLNDIYHNKEKNTYVSKCDDVSCNCESTIINPELETKMTEHIQITREVKTNDPLTSDLMIESIFGKEFIKKHAIDLDKNTKLTSNKAIEEIFGLAALTKKQNRSEEVVKLYNNLGRPSIDNFIETVNSGAIIGTSVTSADIRANESLLDKDGARAVATIHNVTNKQSITPVANSIGEVIHCDIIFDEYNKPYLFTEDRACKLRTITYLTSKDTKNLTLAFNSINSSYKAYGHTIKKIVSDNESVFKACKKYLNDIGIVINYIPSGQHDQIIERSNRTLQEKVTILKASLSYKLIEKLEHKVYEYAVYLLNRLPNKESYPSTPYELFTGEKFDVRLIPLAPFGEIGVFFQSEDLRTKKHPYRGEFGIIVGKLNDTPTGFQVYIPTRDQVVIRTKNYKPIAEPPKEWMWEPNPYKAPKNRINVNNNLEIDEEQINITGNVVDDIDPSYDTNEPEILENEVIINEDEELQLDNTNENTNYDEVTINNTIEEEIEIPKLLIDTNKNNESKVKKKTKKNNTLSIEENNNIRVVESDRFNFRIRKPRKQYLSTIEEFNNELKDLLDISITSDINVECFKTYIKEALSKNNPRREFAYDAIYKELKQMKDMNVFHTIKFSDIPHEYRKQIISSIMFLKDKFKADGEFDKTKARLAGRGDEQKRKNYVTLINELFSSPTANLLSIMIILSIATKYKCLVSTLDIPGAYLHALLKENTHIYMTLPKECIDIWFEICGLNKAEYIHDDGNVYVKLNRALYGLQQSSLLWYETIKNVLLEADYNKTNCDVCVFIKNLPNQFIIVVIYVDDILVVSTNQSLVDELHEIFNQAFGKITKQSGDKISFLSMLISIDKTNNTIEIDQITYINKIIDEFESKYGIVKESNYPSNGNLFNKTDQYESSYGQDPPKINIPKDIKTDYISILMSLMYVAIRTRLDILKEVTYLTTFVNDPSATEWYKLYKVIGYLKKYSKLSLVFTSNESNKLEIYADASYRVHENTAGHSGIIIRLYGNTIFGKSNKQKIITKSSTEAELIALDEATTYCIWIMELLNELNINYEIPVLIYQDNLSTITLAEAGKGNFKRTKHILNRYFWIKQFIDSGEIKLMYLPTRQMIADLLTKPVIGALFKQLIYELYNYYYEKYLNKDEIIEENDEIIV